MRGAWIEIITYGRTWEEWTRRSPCGEHGLKFAVATHMLIGFTCRSPCGERGLKSPAVRLFRLFLVSLPVRGAWIEILLADVNNTLITVAPRAGSVD